MHITAAIVFIITALLLVNDLGDLMTGFDNRDAAGVQSATQHLATPSFIQVGMAINREAADVYDRPPPCAPVVPCLIKPMLPAITPPIMTFFD